MSVYIPSMEMPKSCDDCFLPLRYCPYAMKPNEECPLIPVPPHGDLIDRDALPVTEEWFYHEKREYVTQDAIKNAPVVIPRDRRQEDARSD